jgi:uncharacterized lipoprotein NlpE involved in copper resistance
MVAAVPTGSAPAGEEAGQRAIKGTHQARPGRSGAESEHFQATQAAEHGLPRLDCGGVDIESAFDEQARDAVNIASIGNTDLDFTYPFTLTRTLKVADK